MLTQRKMILLVIGLHAVLAWLPPERCKQGNFLRSKRDSTAYPPLISSAFAYPNLTITAPVIKNITEIALNQNKNLNETYSDAKFFGVPIRGSARPYCVDYEIYFPNNCKFHTYSPRLLSSVYCQEGIACKLVHTVSTTKSYTASEGYNWGVKISAKANLFPSVFEVGGEVSSGGSYTCTYTEGRTTTDTVECSVPSASGQTLQLYNVQSDMECQFSTVTMVSETRNGKAGSQGIASRWFNAELMDTLLKYAIIASTEFEITVALLNLDRTSDEILEKLKYYAPDYNPYTDLATFLGPDYSYYWLEMHYREGKVAPGPKRIIPFTNENGDSVYQYACVLT